MQLEIGFYGKDKVSVGIEFNELESQAAKESLELLLFAWFALRQFSNLGHNTASNVFAGILMWDEALTEAVKENPKLPAAVEILIHSHFAGTEEEFRKKGLDESIWQQSWVIGEYFRVRTRLLDDPAVKVVDRDFLLNIPEIVDSQGKPGDKRFIAIFGLDSAKKVWQETLHIKGFGFLGSILGLRINYYACHSILALLRFLARRHSTDQMYVNRLSFVAQRCGEAHHLGSISMLNQLELADRIMRTLTLSEEIAKK